jgi:hypothetical protein
MGYLLLFVITNSINLIDVIIFFLPIGSAIALASTNFVVPSEIVGINLKPALRKVARVCETETLGFPGV